MNVKAKDLTVVVCSWKSPKLLRTCIESLLASFTTDAKVAVALNEGDEESQRYLSSKGIEFVSLPYNHGALSVDYLYPFISSEYVCNVNDDMLFIEGWDAELIRLISENYPASSSCFLVEPVETGNSVVHVDSSLEAAHIAENPAAADPMGGTNGNLRHDTLCNPRTQDLFSRAFLEGRYKREHMLINYTHPIMTTASDFAAVGGYSANLDLNWFPGYGLDDYFAYRLCMLHPEGFRFLVSDIYPVYHGMSVTNVKLSQEEKEATCGAPYFEKVTGGLHMAEFSRLIHRDARCIESYAPPNLVRKT